MTPEIKNTKRDKSLPLRLTIYRVQVILAAILCLIEPGFSYAEETAVIKQPDKNWYQIEVLIFDHLNRSDYLIEPGQTTPLPVDKKNRHILVSGTPTSGSQLQQLKSETLKLNGHRKKLSRSKNFRPVFLAGWKQFISENGPPSPVGINVEAKDLNSNLPILYQGTITVRKSRYLHLDVDLAKTESIDVANLPVDQPLNPLSLPSEPNSKLTQENTEPSHSAIANPTIITANSNNDFDVDSPVVEPAESTTLMFNRLKTTRRMRSGELHYIDFPVFGLLALVYPTHRPDYAKKTVEPDQTAGHNEGAGNTDDSATAPAPSSEALVQ